MALFHEALLLARARHSYRRRSSVISVGRRYLATARSARNAGTHWAQASSDAEHPRHTKQFYRFLLLEARLTFHIDSEADSVHNVCGTRTKRGSAYADAIIDRGPQKEPPCFSVRTNSLARMERGVFDGRGSALRFLFSISNVRAGAGSLKLSRSIDV